jgi:hypothetical protein
MMSDSRTCIRLTLLFTLVTGAFFAPCTARPQASEYPNYQGVEIHPGDVINFNGGWVTTASQIVGGAVGEITHQPPHVGSVTYGHTAMYIGINPENGKRTYLDFTTTKEPQIYRNGGITPTVGSLLPFVGRILSEEAFLTANSTQHTSFDVFRLDGVSNLSPKSLLHEAQLISKPEVKFGFPIECSMAVSKVLSATTGLPIDIVSPDSFMRPPFQKLPALRDRSIDIQAALREVKAVDAVDARSAQLQKLVPQMVAARRIAHRTQLTLEEYETLTEVRKQQLRIAQWDYLRTLVGYACSDPGNLSTLNDQGQVAGVTLDLKDLSAYFDGTSARISGCERQLLANIIASPGPVSIQSLVSWGIKYRSEHNIIIDVKHFLAKIADYCAVVVDTFISIADSVADALQLPSAADDSSSSSSDNTGSNHSTSAPTDWSSFASLRGVEASGGSWPD